MLLVGKNLSCGDCIVDFLCVLEATLGCCTDSYWSGDHLPCKNTLQTMEKFGTMRKETSVR